ncbi:heavy metal sensor histidine kinase [Pseudomonas sp. DTU_2021_1001937_2_SI_NGA_ILE_001]|uniref:heavy metal sensor histidine kinase n=1 Tax=Pseudomonas sp. DTU_2021_1001937_2_SI_NGA_ILE_001 TaxID=3077589 RepID=UPI0028FC2A88|nr:heavy metal sensor histidine kinase [Pseudomonas sp. DTU_2021_1001937_2_SI_NGA_ILE_001]WNW09839.1 heavy metal sensor histidine kinase [Pseudomonas sp. DTU_2021_1001937_2_SI_NGA_ILE_001]
MKPARPSMRLSMRLGLTVSALCALLVLGMATLSCLTISRQLDDRARNELTDKLNQVRHSLTEGYWSGADRGLNSHSLRDQIIGHDNFTLTLLDSSVPRKRLLVIGKDEDTVLPPLFGSGQPDDFVNLSSPQGHDLLSASRLIQLRSGQQVMAVLTLDRQDDANLLQAYVQSTLVAMPVIFLLAGGGAWWVVRRALRPLKAFRKVAGRVSARDLSQRLTSDGLPDELQELAKAINIMLQRLDDDVRQLTQFSDDLAHELRSPMNNLMGKAQVTLSRPRPAEDYKQALESCTEELERLSRMVSQMLYLASVSQPSAPLAASELDLRAEAERVVELFALTAEDKGIRLEIEGQATALGDRLMVQRAFSNLLSNAIRHAPDCSPVRLQLRMRDGQASLAVSNPGEGIAAEHLPRLFDRFYRVHASRARHQGGTGLGLAIVRSIMHAHAGQVSVSSATNGLTTFTLTFPAPTSTPHNASKAHALAELQHAPA